MPTYAITFAQQVEQVLVVRIKASSKAAAEMLFSKSQYDRRDLVLSGSSIGEQIIEYFEEAA